VVQKTKVLLNLYDLSPANDYLFQIGLGLHHSGLEIAGREYSYGSGGSGIFEHAPKDAPGARFRCQMDLGSYDGGMNELNRALDDLRTHGGFGPDGYNLLRKNCNHFCNALSWKLLKTPIPAHVNRLAELGNCCSCFLPKQLLEGSPVGGDGGGASHSFAVPTTRAAMNRGGTTAGFAFAGKGHSLGSSTTSTSSGGSGDGGGKAESVGLLSQFTRSIPTPTSANEDLTDRREKARKAALARLERNHPQQQQTFEKQS
jgi:deubiquitinase DESI2